MTRTAADPTERFWRFVNKTGPVPDYRPDLGPCWLWTGGKSKGYGMFRAGGRGVPLRQAYRYSYILAKGHVPDGLQLDHLCRVHACVNPEHLEPVTQLENVRRGYQARGIVCKTASRVQCHKGHVFSGNNSRVDRQGVQVCRVCEHAEYERKRDAGLCTWQRRPDPRAKNPDQWYAKHPERTARHGKP